MLTSSIFSRFFAVSTNVLALVFWCCNVANATIYHITPTGAGSFSGTSWANARAGAQLQNTINAALSGDEIWVAAGTYKPTQNTANNTNPADVREKCFVMKAGVKILGGFPATGAPLLTARKPFLNKTVLSGELQNDNNANNNAYNIIKNYRNNLVYSAILDGFWIMGGAGGANNGSGMLIDLVSPAIYNCVFSENTSADGGALSIANNSSPKFTTCIFMNNTATNRGGAISVASSSPSFANTLFFNNKATTGGAALFTGGNANLTFYVCDIHGNSTTGTGSLVYADGSNNRFNIYNSIVWSNTGTGLIYEADGVILRTIQNSIYPALTPGTAQNIDRNPLYLAEWDPDGADNQFGTEDDGLGLLPSSPAVGLGSVNLMPSGITTDITGSPRVSGTKIDAGAYEYQVPVATENENASEQANLEIYPNPTQDFVRINTENGLQNANFKLFNAVGALVLSEKISAFANDTPPIISLTDLPQGIYFYQIATETQTFKGKILKN